MNDTATSHTRAAARYLLGFLGSAMLTLLAFTLTDVHLSSHHVWPPDQVLAPVLIALAVVQLVVQLALFLHVGSEAQPRWKLMVTLFAGLIVLVIVVGSLWIMNNLNYRMGSPSQTNSAIIKDEGIQP